MSLLLMKALIEDGGSLMPYGFMVEDVKHCSQFFIQLHYYHTRKESNNIVHRLDMQ